MKSKIIIFIVFAVVVQRSLAVKETPLLTQLAEIHSGGNGTLKAFYAIIDGFFDTMCWLADLSSRNEDYDLETILKLKSIEEILVGHLLTAWHETQAGMNCITMDNSTFTNSDEEKLKEVIEIVYSPFYEIIRGKSYVESAAAINAIEKIAIPKVIESWISVYDIFLNAISSDELVIDYAIQAITPKEITDGKRAFSAIFAGFKILLMEVSGKTQSGSGTFSSAIETERNFARIYITDDVHTKFTLFQYIATARYLKDTTIVTDFIQIAVSELGMNNEFDHVCESVFTAIDELSGNKGVSCTNEALSEKLTASLYAPVLSGVVTFSGTQSKGSSVDGIDSGTAYKILQTASGGIIDAIKLTQKSTTCDVQVDVEKIEKKVIAAVIDVFEETYIVMKNIASSLGHDAVAIIESSSRNASMAINNAFTNMFTAIKMIALRDTFEAELGYCDTGTISAIKIVRDAASAGFKKEILLKFDIIRIFHLFEFLQVNNISVPFSLLRVA